MSLHPETGCVMPRDSFVRKTRTELLPKRGREHRLNL